jgi:hypothetical protein
MTPFILLTIWSQLFSLLLLGILFGAMKILEKVKNIKKPENILVEEGDPQMEE